ncbi:O-antigen ligase family protein [Dehalococcoidia bacterium]|nr:O-antigen ligase family protein [Dehalococcoidia bacterium]
MYKTAWMWLRLIDLILMVQPLLAVPIFCSVLLGKPPLWLSCLIAVTPLALRLWRDGHLFRRTPFDLPILLFVLGLLVGLVVSPNQAVSLEALFTFLACILIYYGIVSNSYAKNSYWLSVAGILCLLALGLSIWFFSQGQGRLLFFNEWAFKLAEPLPKLPGPVLHLHGVAAVLVLVIPPLLAIAVFKSRPWLRLIGLILGSGFLTMLVLLASGSGWISVTLGVILIILCWRWWMAGVVLPAVGFITWLVVVNYDKVFWLPQVFSWGSFLGRVDLWRNTVNLLIDKPFTGLGLGTWLEVYYNDYAGTTTGLYNSYLQLLSDTGFLGLVALIWAAVIWLRLSQRILFSSRQSHWYGIGIGIIGSIVAGTAFAFVETTIAGTIVGSATSYHYIGVPLLWIWAALFIVAYNHLLADINL